MTKNKSPACVRRTGRSDFVTEPAKQRSVLYDVDVAVAGSGLCSTFAAIAAGRCGAKTVLIERFGSLGGNIGPGMIINGSLAGEAETTLPGGVAGIAKEFMERLEALRIGPMNRYPEEASIVSYLAYDTAKKADVELLLSAYAADPIMEDNTVRGLFVECKSGRVAVKAKVTVDGTGDADIALRAGAPIIPYMETDNKYVGRRWRSFLDKRNFLDERYPTYYNDTQILCLVAEVNLDKFNSFCSKDVVLTGEEKEWGEREFANYLKSLIPALRRAWISGEFRHVVEVEPNVSMSTGHNFRDYGNGIVWFHISCRGAINASDPKQIARLEGSMREQAFKAVLFYRKNAPGFEKAYLLTFSTFLGMRGGPHIDGEHTLTLEDRFDGRKCDDVLFRNIHLGQKDHGGEPSGFDVPYGICLPKNIDGLLVCGRGAAYLRRGHDPCDMRARPCMMVFGQAVGTAAGIAALDNVTPQNVDLKKLQKRLVAEGIYLGDENRLRELGIK